MRTKMIFVIAMAALGLGVGGCPALMIPGLAYSGYQYEKTGSITGQPTASSSSSSSKKSSSKSSASSSPSSTAIE